MDIWMIWATLDGDSGKWLVDAWDDDSTAENWSGWLAAIKKARDEVGAENVRVVKARINFDKVLDAFNVQDATDESEIA